MNNHKTREREIKSCSLSLCKRMKITSGVCTFWGAISKWLRVRLYVFFQNFTKNFLWLHEVLAMQKICIIRKESIPCGLYCTIPIALFLSIKKYRTHAILLIRHSVFPAFLLKVCFLLFSAYDYKIHQSAFFQPKFVGPYLGQ